jgi:osmotically-inducible protein OsmY
MTDRELTDSFANGYVDDVGIASRVRNALDASPDVTKQTVTVEAHDGLVTLRGNTGSHWERMAAEEVTRSVCGVRDVRNLLVVDLIEKTDYDELSHVILETIARACGPGGSDIHVAVSNNQAVLSGRVPSLAHKEMAQAAAGRFGLDHVRNDIVVASELEAFATADS